MLGIVGRCLAAAIVLLSAGVARASEVDVRVFAAASTTNALTEIGEAFAAQGKGKVLPSFASSSALARQIEQGAPADLFVSADERWMSRLVERKAVVPGSRSDLLGNRLVLIAPADGAKAVDLKPGANLAAVLGAGRLAMGDPDHVPAGTYGKKALEALGAWKTVESKVARTDNVRAALALVERGEAPLGVVYATDAAISDKVRIVATFPEDTHPPIVYPVAIVAGRDTPAVRAFLDFLRSAEARSIFARHGFTVR